LFDDKFQAISIFKQNISDQRIKQAVDIILSYQNKNGGWPTYELSRAPSWLEKLNPSEVFADIMIDYSWTECSAACVVALLEILELYPDYKRSEIEHAITDGWVAEKFFMRFMLGQNLHVINKVITFF
jgi:lanosterol synthase